MLVLRTAAPALPAALPVAVRIGLIYVVVAGGSAALSIVLMKTPVLSRLVGRAAPLPLAPSRSTPATTTRQPQEVQQTPSPQSPQTARAREPRQVEPAAARDADLRPVALASAADTTAMTAPVLVAAGHTAQAPREADASASRAADSSRGAIRRPDADLPSRASAPRYTNPRMVTVHLDGWPRVTRPLPMVEHPDGHRAGGERLGRARITIDFRNGLTGKEDADELSSAPVDTARATPRAQGWRDERRWRAWELRQQGWKQKDIAAELRVSPSTVSGWLRREREDELAAPDAAPDESADVASSVPRVQRAIVTKSRSHA
jgi:hypothetical protein